MAQNSKKYKDLFKTKSYNSTIDDMDKPNKIENGYIINYDKLNVREVILYSIDNHNDLDTLIMREDEDFKQLIISMFVIDPNKRVSCKEALESDFFKDKE